MYPRSKRAAGRWLVIALLALYGSAALVAGWILALLYVRTYYGY